MILKVFKQGVKDGFGSPRDLGSGMTYDNPKLNEMYDRGVNVGQFFGKAFGR